MKVSKTEACVVSGQGTAKLQPQSCPRIGSGDWRDQPLERGSQVPRPVSLECLLSVPPNVCVPALWPLLWQILIRNRATDLDARMHDGTTPLILAARLAVEGMLDDLINCHADVNAVDDLGTAGN